ncbi:FxLD family lanthipeptide [Actinacidiphila sp. bgisy144]
MDIVTSTPPKAVEGVDLDLDVRIVTAGPVAAALLSSTDDGCDTQKNGDC